MQPRANSRDLTALVVPARPDADHFDIHRHESGLLHLQNVRRRRGNVDDPVIIAPRPAVVDAHLDAAPIRAIRHAHHRAKRQMAMGGREFVGIETLTARRRAAVLRAVPGGDAAFGVTRRKVFRDAGAAAYESDRGETRHGTKKTMAIHPELWRQAAAVRKDFRCGAIVRLPASGDQTMSAYYWLRSTLLPTCLASLVVFISIDTIRAESPRSLLGIK